MNESADKSADIDGLRLRFPEGWLDDHALIRADLESELGELAKVGMAVTFC